MDQPFNEPLSPGDLLIRDVVEDSLFGTTKYYLLYENVEKDIWHCYDLVDNTTRTIKVYNTDMWTFYKVT